MLARPQRLTKQKDFALVFKQGRSHYGKCLSVKSLANQLKLNRLAVVVSNRVSKKAVARNKLKRQIRQALNKLNKGLISGFDLIIIASPRLLGQPYSVIESDLAGLFVKLKLVKK